MKVKVLEKFRDKHDHVTIYEKGTILEVQDAERAQSLIDRQLAKEFKGNQKAAVTLTEPSGNAEGAEPQPGSSGDGDGGGSE
jgi:hypothetical protein